MNPLKNVNTPDDVGYSKVPEKVSTVENLPNEVLSYILSFLNNREMHSPLKVNRHWKDVSIGTVRSREQSSIKKFTKFLAGNMQPPYSSQMEQLLSSENDEKIFGNLKEIKAFSLEFRGKVLNILKDLKKKELDSLEELSADKSKPNSFENIFALAKIYKSLGKLKRLSEKPSSSDLESISYKLAKSGDLDKALEVANSIPDEERKSYALRGISVKLAKAGKFNESLGIANSILGGDGKSLTLMNISVELAKAGEFYQALEVANSMPDNSKKYKSFALEGISVELAKAGRFDQALEVASISGEWREPFALKKISVELAKAGKFDQALEAASAISSELHKSSALMNISVELAKAGEFGQALEVANTIPDEWSRSCALKGISVELAKAGEFSQALKLTNTIYQK